MIKRILALTGFAAVMLTTSISQAIYLEPYLGLYSVGTIDASVPAVPTSLSYNTTGSFALGLRAGYSVMGLSFGLEYQMGTLNTNVTAGPGTGTTDSLAVTNIGAFAGFDVPIIPIRAYVGYIFSGKGQFNSTGTTDSGAGTKIGVGFTGLPFVNINLEYFMLKYDTANPASAGFSANAKAVMLAVALPLHF